MSTLLYKQQASRLADHFSSAHKFRLKDARALEAIAAVHGCPDWNTLVGNSAVPREPAPGALAGPTPSVASALFAVQSFSDPAFCASVLTESLSVQCAGWAERHVFLKTLVTAQARRGGFLYVNFDTHPESSRALNLREILAGCDRAYFEFADQPRAKSPFNVLSGASTQHVLDIILASFPSVSLSSGADYYLQHARHAVTTVVAALETIGAPVTVETLSTLFTEPLTELPLLLAKVPEGDAKTGLNVWLRLFHTRTKEGTVLDQKQLTQTLGGLGGRLFQLAHRGPGLSGEPLLEQGWSELWACNGGMLVSSQSGAPDSTNARVLRQSLMAYLQGRDAAQSKLRLPVILEGDGAHEWATRELQRLLRDAGCPVISVAGPSGDDSGAVQVRVSALDNRGNARVTLKNTQTEQTVVAELCESSSPGPEIRAKPNGSVATP